MPTYKLTFYNIPATAEVSRMLFFLAGVEFEDNRLEFNSKEWKELKPSKKDNVSSITFEFSRFEFLSNSLNYIRKYFLYVLNSLHHMCKCFKGNR